MTDSYDEAEAEAARERRAAFDDLMRRNPDRPAAEQPGHGTPRFAEPDWRMRPRFEPQRRQRKRLDTDQTRNAEADWSGWETWLRSHLDNERAYWEEVVGDAIEQIANQIVEQLDSERDARRDLETKIAKQDAEIARTRVEIAELEMRLAGVNRKGVLDLPNPLKTVN
jgi:hypothetical protein